MRHFLIFCAALMTACSPSEPVYVDREIPTALTTPCAEPVKGSSTEGGFAELAIGWKHTSRCNADKLERIAAYASSQNRPR